MPLSHTLLVVAVVFIWGTNFVPIRFGLDEFPPFTFAALRFLFAVLPWILVVSRPKVALRWLALFGLLVGPGQFGLLYYAMQRDISPGLASLMMQTQVFMTIILAAWLFGERVATSSLVGLAVASVGLMVIGTHTGASVTPKGVAVILLAASCWAMGNLIIKRAARDTPGGIPMLPFMIWSSLFAFPPLLALAMVVEGAQITRAVQSASWIGWSALAWQSIGNTLIGFGVWNWLLTRHKADLVTPYALLVPVFGMSASALWTGESMPLWKIQAAACVLAGLAIHAFAPRLLRRAAVH